ncbi:MAG: acyl-CoA dehydrogenase [Cyanobacteria bacterium RYN_339]|nr:acyl-CoA dehydrogenase [Cyanobacteria bacterium RYN_339]
MLDYAAYLAAVGHSYWEQDPAAQDALAATLAPEWLDWARPRFEATGARAASVWADLAATANENPPKLRSHNRWGERIMEVEVHPAYEQLAREVYEAGVVWPRFNEVQGGKKAPWGVVFGLGYLMSQAEQGLFCPVCLTAGTAWLLERFADADLKAKYLPKVAAADYDELMEGAMFLTERAGGSDVGANVVEARQEDGVWKLYGDKWFASNAGRAKAMMVLARPAGAPGGTRGLGLFLVPRDLDDGSLNPIRINRLKDKLGTKSMPSGELTFEGAVGYPVGPVERGFACMAEMLNLSRIYNAVASVGNMRRTINTAIAYAHARTAFGQVIDRAPMVQAKLVALEVEQEAGLRLVFEAIALLDKAEAGQATTREELALRVLTPLIKYHTAREAVDTASACAELLGGNGYIEEWPIARFMRDGQVLPIWEGTTNILVLDVLRSFAKEGTGPALLAWYGEKLSKVVPPALANQHGQLAAQVADLEQHLLALADLPDADKQLHAKGWCDRALRIGQGLMLLEAAARDATTGAGRGVLVLAAFMQRHYTPGGWRQQLQGASPALGFEAIVRKQPVSLDDAVASLREPGMVAQS